MLLAAVYIESQQYGTCSPACMLQSPLLYAWHCMSVSMDESWMLNKYEQQLAQCMEHNNKPHTFHVFVGCSTMLGHCKGSRVLMHAEWVLLLLHPAWGLKLHVDVLLPAAAVNHYCSCPV
jgi:hypothetical protein